MLLELAVGDAYGAGFEYAEPDFVARHNDLSAYQKHPHHAIRPGAYTDDTQMSIAVAEAIADDLPWTPETLAAKFVEAFKRDPRFGYASRFYDFLRRVETGAQFLAEIVPASDRSGAAMRALPIGVFSIMAEVIQRSTLQARLTHDTPDGIAAAVAASLMSHYFLYDVGPKRDLTVFLEKHVPGHRWGEPWRGHVGAKGWMSVRAAVTALVAHDRLSDLLRACVAFGGDVDTVATIALGAASCSREVEQDLPEPLTAGLENTRYGHDYLVALDRRLLARVTRLETA